MKMEKYPIYGVFFHLSEKYPKNGVAHLENKLLSLPQSSVLVKNHRLRLNSMKNKIAKYELYPNDGSGQESRIAHCVRNDGTVIVIAKAQPEAIQVHTPLQAHTHKLDCFTSFAMTAWLCH